MTTIRPNTRSAKAMRNGIVIAVAFIHCCICGAVAQSGCLSTITQTVAGGGLLAQGICALMFTLSTVLCSSLILKAHRNWSRKNSQPLQLVEPVPTFEN